MHEEFDVPNNRGLSSLLLGDITLPEGVQRVEGLDLLTSGPKPPNPSEMLGSPRMKALLVEVKPDYDFILLDTPPLLPVTDGAVVARQGAGVLIVADTGRVRSRQLTNALKNLATVDAHVLGIVLN